MKHSQGDDATLLWATLVISTEEEYGIGAQHSRGGYGAQHSCLMHWWVSSGYKLHCDFPPRCNARQSFEAVALCDPMYNLWCEKLNVEQTSNHWIVWCSGPSDLDTDPVPSAQWPTYKLALGGGHSIYQRGGGRGEGEHSMLDFYESYIGRWPKNKRWESCCHQGSKVQTPFKRSKKGTKTIVLLSFGSKSLGPVNSSPIYWQGWENILYSY